MWSRLIYVFLNAQHSIAHGINYDVIHASTARRNLWQD